ncbi:YqiA/YcfP family alpha/beta fold hydrolase [Winogradskyella sediminis]|uniref:YqiA/YcfP family alpha/beta fold hydrolase n=1 Tax=Winogradskyella sediminis TaxID=1382466 RepID=UPI003AA80775
MNILYIHGLNGSLSPEKRALLEPYGEIFSPAIDYESNPNAIATLITTYKTRAIDIVMGSSMGGFTGYYVSNMFQCPALLFNPALAERSVPQNLVDIPHPTSVYKQIVLGTKDAIVNPKHTLNFLSETLVFHPHYNLRIHNHLAHRIPLTVFKDEITVFFKHLSDANYT